MAQRSSPKPSRTTGGRTKPAPPKRRSVLWRFRRSLFLVALLLVAGVAGAGFVLAQVELPDEEPLLQSTFVCAADVTENCGPDNAIAKLSGEEDRVSLALAEMPQIFLDAVLAAEDRQFYSHSGIDPIGIARALYRDFRNEGVQQGGSTITQQYAKNAFLSSERTISRKLKEAVLAVKLERDLSKDEILQRYLNTVYFGRGAYGAEAGARAHFNISVRNVNLAQAAYLAGLIRSPETADATRDPEVAAFRRDSVLAGMLEEGMITQAEHDEAKAVDITSLVSPRPAREGLEMLRGESAGATYYVEYVRRLLYEKYGADKVNGGGLRVYTSVDLDMQRLAYDAVWNTLDQPDDPAGALVSIDEFGRVVAMVGGKDFDASEVNLALGAAAGGSGRQPGSSFKPIVLATALDEGMSVYSRFLDENRKTFPRANAGEDWKVSNYADGEEGIVDLIQATRKSSNTVYAELMLEVGPTDVVDMAHRLGVTADVPAVNALALGTGDVSVLDMASAYSTFSRRGRAIEPIMITKVEQVIDGEVEVLQLASTKAEDVLDTNVADQVNWILRQVVLGGTGANANFGVPVAGKTGTTQDYRDAWFVGYSPKLTTAVWMGFPDLDENGEPIYMRDVRGRRVTGGSFPAQIWRAFMSAAMEGQSHGSFAEPTFGGEVFNSDLTTTTTEPPPCGPEPEVEDGESPPTTEECRPTTTTTDPDDCDPDEDDDCDDGDGDGDCDPDEDDDCDDGSTTTTTDPDGSTSTSTTAPGSSTTTSSTSTSSTSTTTPSSSSTTQAPTTTEFLIGEEAGTASG